MNLVFHVDQGVGGQLLGAQTGKPKYAMRSISTQMTRGSVQILFCGKKNPAKNTSISVKTKLKAMD